MILRPASPEDAHGCAKILSDWIAETPWFPDLHSRAEDVVFVQSKIEGAEAFVLADPAIKGFVVRDGDYVACLYVAGPARGQGLGTRLLDRAKAGAGALRLWTFQANWRAQAFYRRQGFSEGRRTDGDNEEGLPDVEFLWTRKAQERAAP